MALQMAAGVGHIAAAATERNQPHRYDRIPPHRSPILLPTPSARSDLVQRCLSRSTGRVLSRVTGPGWLRGHVRDVEALTGRPLQVHQDQLSASACRMLGADAFCRPGHIYLGSRVGAPEGPSVDHVLAHELAHIVQFHRGRSTTDHDDESLLEAEAIGFAADPQRPIRAIRGRAEPGGIYCLFWLIPIAAGAYMVLRPSPANAPGPADPIQPGVSSGQVAGETLALFAVPGAAYTVAGRLGLGWLTSSGVAGAATTTSLRAVQDLGTGTFSGIDVYVFDAATGAVIGVVVPGGIRLIGSRTTTSLDWLATHGMRRSDLLITQRLVERAGRGPVAEAEALAIMNSPTITGRMAQSWLNRRGMIILYRGQAQHTERVLSPLARGQGVPSSEALVARMRALGITDDEIALYTASWHTQPVRPYATLPELAYQPLGAVGIPTTRIPGIASGFGDEGVVYVIRLPQDAAIRVPQWGLSLENEWVVLNQLPEGSVVNVLRPSSIPGLTLDEAGRMIRLGQ